MKQRFVAEMFGTFWLVFGGCGSAVFSAMYLSGGHQLGIGFLGVALAFGLTVLTMAYTIGHISGCHLNPAVTVGLIIGKRFKASEGFPYIAAQVVGGLLAAFALYTIVSGNPDYGITDSAGSFATNGYGDYSPGKYSLISCLAAEVILTAFFLIIIMGATDKRAPAGFAPIAIGLGLTLIHLVGIPITNLSVNPARSTGPAVICAVNNFIIPATQLWLFWAAPILGAVIGAFLYNYLAAEAPPATSTAA